MAPARSEQSVLSGFARSASFVCEVEIRLYFERRSARFYRLGRKMLQNQAGNTDVFARDNDPRKLIVGVPEVSEDSAKPALSTLNDPTECTQVWWSNPEHSGEECGYIVYKNFCSRPVDFTVLKIDSWARGRWQYGHALDILEPRTVLFFEGDCDHRCKPGRDCRNPRGRSWVSEIPSTMGLQQALDEAQKN